MGKREHVAEKLFKHPTTTGFSMPGRIKKKYEILRRKHKLPAYMELENDFEIGRADPDGLLLREIRRKMLEKIHEITSLLEEILHPEASLVGLYESRVFDETEKKEIFEIYKQLLAAIRHSTELAVESNEKLEAEFISLFYMKWVSMKPALLKFTGKLKMSWEKDTDEDEKTGYMG